MSGTITLKVDGESVKVRWGASRPPTEADVEDIASQWRAKNKPLNPFGDGASVPGYKPSPFEGVKAGAGGAKTPPVFTGTKDQGVRLSEAGTPQNQKQKKGAAPVQPPTGNAISNALGQVAPPTTKQLLTPRSESKTKQIVKDARAIEDATQKRHRQRFEQEETFKTDEQRNAETMRSIAAGTSFGTNDPMAGKGINAAQADMTQKIMRGLGIPEGSLVGEMAAGWIPSIMAEVGVLGHPGYSAREKAGAAANIAANTLPVELVAGKLVSHIADAMKAMGKAKAATFFDGLSHPLQTALKAMEDPYAADIARSVSKGAARNAAAGAADVVQSATPPPTATPPSPMRYGRQGEPQVGTSGQSGYGYGGRTRTPSATEPHPSPIQSFIDRVTGVQKQAEAPAGNARGEAGLSVSRLDPSIASYLDELGDDMPDHHQSVSRVANAIADAGVKGARQKTLFNWLVSQGITDDDLVERAINAYKSQPVTNSIIGDGVDPYTLRARSLNSVGDRMVIQEFEDIAKEATNRRTLNARLEGNSALRQSASQPASGTGDARSLDKEGLREQQDLRESGRGREGVLGADGTARGGGVGGDLQRGPRSPERPTTMGISNTGVGQGVARLEYSGKNKAVKAWIDAINNATSPKISRIIRRSRGGIGEFVVTDGGVEIARIKENGLPPEVRSQLKIGERNPLSDSDVTYHDVELRASARPEAVPSAGPPDMHAAGAIEVVPPVETGTIPPAGINPPTATGVPVPSTAYHGTTAANADAIERGGFKVQGGESSYVGDAQISGVALSDDLKHYGYEGHLAGSDTVLQVEIKPGLNLYSIAADRLDEIGATAAERADWLKRNGYDGARIEWQGEPAETVILDPKNLTVKGRRNPYAQEPPASTGIANAVQDAEAGRTTSHADTDAVRALAGWDPRQATEESIGHWMAQAKEHAGKESAIASDILEKNRQATKDEEAALGVRLNQLLTERDAAKRKGDIEQYDIIDADANKIADALDVSGAEWGRQGVARQIVLREDYTDFGLKRRAVKAKGQATLSKAENAKIAELSGRVADLEAKLQAALEKRGAGSQLRPARGSAEGIKARRADALTRLKEHGGKAVAEVAVAPIGHVLGVGGGGAGFTHTAEAFTALADLARTYVDEGLMHFEELVGKLKEHKLTGFTDQDYGKAVREALGAHGRDINRGRIAYGEDMMASGQWAIKDKEIAKLRAQLDLAKAEADAHVKSLEPKEWYVKAIREITGGVRALRLAYDIGALLRQGFMGVGSPKKYAAAVGRGIGGMLSNDIAHGMQLSIENRILGDRHMAPIRKRAGLQLTNSLTMHEEAFMSTLMRNIPGIKSIYLGTERFQTTFMNSLRADFFDSFASKFPDATEPELKQYAQFVNNAFGRSNIKEVPEEANILFTSPRWTTSRIALLGDVVKAGLKPGSKASMAIAFDVAKVAGVWYSAYKMLESSGGEVNWDYTSPDFMKVRFGDQVYDFTGGTSRPIRAILRMVIGTKYGQTLQDEAGKYAINSLSPLTRTGYEQWRGEGMGGMDLDENNQGLKAWIPLIAAQAWTQIEHDGLGPGTAKILPEFVGVSANTYPKRTKPLQERKTFKGRE